MIDKITELTAALGLTVLMAEQNFEQATRIATRGYVLVHGQVILAAVRTPSSSRTRKESVQPILKAHQLAPHRT